jgi:hypothetical protein
MLTLGKKPTKRADTRPTPHNYHYYLAYSITLFPENQAFSLRIQRKCLKI